MLKRNTLLVAMIAAVMMAATCAASSAAVVGGDTTIESHVDTAAAGTGVTFSFVASTTATASSIGVYLDSTSTAADVTVALYSNYNGHPEVRLMQHTFTSPVAGWNTESSTGRSLKAGATYWLGILGNHGTVAYRDQPSGSCTEHSTDATRLNKTFPYLWANGGATSNNCPASEYASSSSTTAAPVNTALPSVSGTATEGDTLTTTNGSWSNSPTSYTDQWVRCSSSCSNISGATSSTYVLTSSDVGDKIQGVVAATNSTGSASAASNQTATVASSTEQPSGEAMPTGSISGWTYVAGDDFSGTSLNTSLWGNTYYGQPGGDPGGWWNPSHIVVGGGEVALKGYKDSSSGAPAGSWTTAGMKMTGLSQTYGKYEVRAKMDNGTGIGPVLMLWPTSNTWPPEIDFAENNGSNPRTTVYGTVHYGSNNTQIGSQTNVDWSQWHTYGVEWTAEKVVYTLDGAVWATVNNANVPSVPMELVMQTGENGATSCAGGWEQCTDSTTPAEVDLDVDWVVAYR